MFTGIIETLGEVIEIKKKNGNLDISIKSSISKELKIGQSISHNGICLTVVAFSKLFHKVTAVEESLMKSTLGDLKIRDYVNLERSLKVNSRLDGHFVQGHVDQIAKCTRALKKDGSWIFTFEYDPINKNMTVEKGSISIDGVSLTVINSKTSSFSVSIIPHTYENTTFKNIKKGSRVNLEFDIIGKYIHKLSQN